MRHTLSVLLTFLLLVTVDLGVAPAAHAAGPDEIQNKYAATGGPGGFLGGPTGDVYCGLRDGGCFRPFQRGTIRWSPRTGAHFSRGVIADRRGALRRENGPLG